MHKLNEINKLREAIVRRYFRDLPHYDNHEWMSPDEIIERYAAQGAVDQKVLWAVELGLNIEEINAEADKLDEEDKIRHQKEEEERKERDKRQHEWEKSHVHQWEKRGGLFETRERRCKDSLCREHYWTTQKTL